MAEPIVEARAAVADGDVTALAAVINRSRAVVNACSPDNERTLLHTIADYPGHRKNGLEMAQLLIDHGADVNARFQHPNVATSRETPLHWAASNDDVDLAALLLDAGADIDMDGGVIENGTPLWDATIFGGVHVCNLLIERGAHSNIMSAAAAGRLDLVAQYFDEAGQLTPAACVVSGGSTRTPEIVLNAAFGFACSAGHATMARRLLDAGADPTWESPVGTALARAKERSRGVIVDFLNERGITR